MLHGGRIFCKTDKSADCEEYYSKMGEPLKISSRQRGFLREFIPTFAPKIYDKNRGLNE
jgi:hypothetical protein